MEQSNSLRNCGYCKENKVWNESGKRLKDGTRIYVDAEGRRWAGKRCPECEKQRVFRAVRCDKFERQIILNQLEAQGYEVLSTTIPMTVQKAGRQYTVGLQRAFAQDQKIVLETHDDSQYDEVDLVAILFESVRLCTPSQLKAIASPDTPHNNGQETPEHYSPPPSSPPSTNY